MDTNNLLLLSNTVFFVFSAFAVVASIAVFLLTRASEREKDRELERYKAEAAALVAGANARAAEARERAEKAEVAASHVSSRLAATQSAILAAQAPQRLSPEQSAAVRREIARNKPSRPITFAASADMRAQSFAASLLSLFEDAGAPIADMGLSPYYADGAEKHPLTVFYGSAIPHADVDRLKSALSAAHLAFSEHPWKAADEQKMPVLSGIYGVGVTAPPLHLDQVREH